MATDGGLDRWGNNGPVVWHSETSGLDLWGKDGVYSDYQATPVSGACAVLIGGKLAGNCILVR